jgi:hypothetical protein
MPRKPLPLDGIEELFAYDPDLGAITWIKSPAKAVAGCLDKRNGYWRIKANGKLYAAHRIAWYLHTGEDPGSKDIDHINGNRNDNRACNLRLATRSENMRNTKKRQGGTSNHKGVSWESGRSKWRADIRINGKSRQIGRFDTELEAYAAYCEAAIAHHGEFANFG